MARRVTRPSLLTAVAAWLPVPARVLTSRKGQGARARPRNQGAEPSPSRHPRSMQVSEVAWSDGDGVRRFAAVKEAVRAADEPWAT